MRVLKLLIFPLYFSMVGLKSNNGEKIAHSNYFTNDVAGVLEKIYTICQGWCSASARDRSMAPFVRTNSLYRSAMAWFSALILVYELVKRTP